MRYQKFFSVTAFVAAVVLSMELSAWSAYAAVDKFDAVSAITRISPGVFEGAIVGVGHKSEQVPEAARTDDNPAQTASVPRSSSGEIVFGSPAGDVRVGLPRADIGAVAQFSDGQVYFDNRDGSSTVPIPKADGSLQIVTVIEGPQSPREYAYSLVLPSDSVSTLTVSGAVYMSASDGSLLGVINTPWALDANGVTVPTSFELVDGILTQYVALDTPGLTFPVVADPQFIPFWWGTGIQFSYAETQSLSNARDVASSAAILCGLITGAIGAVACGAAAIAYAGIWLGAFQTAAANGNCGQINVPVGTGPALWIGYEVTC